MQSAVAAAERTTLDPLGAGALLAGVLVLCVGLGAAAGTAVEATGVGVAVGAIVGLPAAVGAVYLRYRGSA